MCCQKRKNDLIRFLRTGGSVVLHGSEQNAQVGVRQKDKNEILFLEDNTKKTSYKWGSAVEVCGRAYGCPGALPGRH